MGGMNTRLEHTMFWTGALMALPPIILAAVILAVALHFRRRGKGRGGGPDDRG